MYSLPRDLYNELYEALGKDRADKITKIFEDILNLFSKEVDKNLTQKKEELKATLYNELRNELATKEFVRAEINEVKAEINEIRAEIKQNTLLLKILIGISIFALTIFNPNFVKLIEKIFN